MLFSLLESSYVISIFFDRLENQRIMLSTDGVSRRERIRSLLERYDRSTDNAKLTFAVLVPILTLQPV